MEKAHITRIAKVYGCTTRYSGKNKTMYIHGIRADEVVDAAQFHYTSFTVCKHLVINA